MSKKILCVLLSSIIEISTLFTGCGDTGKAEDTEKVELVEENTTEEETQNDVSITADESDMLEEQSIANGNTDNAVDRVAENFIDYETLGIQKYEYPSDFFMGENLKAAITQLALSYDNFGKDSVSSENWKEIFIARFIQNSRASFDYLDMISDESGGQISVDQLNYIQWSLTDTELDFASEVGDSINRNDTASSLNYGWISEYSYEETNDGVIVTANFEIGYDGTDSVHRRKITVELIKNPYSCFDGYSVLTVSSEIENSDFEPDSSTHIFYGTDMMDENSGIFLFEFIGAEDSLEYKHFVYVDMTELPELADLVRQNAGKDFKITFIWNEGIGDAIENVEPVDIVLRE